MKIATAILFPIAFAAGCLSSSVSVTNQAVPVQQITAVTVAADWDGFSTNYFGLFEVSPDLTYWQRISVFTVPTNGGTFYATNSSVSPMQFFRAASTLTP